VLKQLKYFSGSRRVWR